MVSPGLRARRRWLFGGVLLLLVWLGIELLAAAAGWIATGEPRWWRTPIVGPAAPVAAAQQAAQAAAQRGIALHPFLGFVVDASLGPVQGFAVSRHGFVDDAEPLRASRPDRYVVGLVGGSVAQQLGVYAGGELAQALQRSAAVGGRTVEIVRLGIGGWKQPQQLLAVQVLQALGGHFDCIVNLDGYNEVALVEENVPLGVPAWFPRSWAQLADAHPEPAQLRRFGQLQLLDDRLLELQHSGASWSPLVHFLRRQAAQRATAQQAQLRAEIAAAPAGGYAVTGPGPGSPSVEAGRAEMAAVWARSSIALHEHCRARSIPYFHLLQPNQYVPGQKPIGAAEAAVALQPGSSWERGAVLGYPLLRAEVPRLQAAGVAFTDLTGIFADHQEPLYVDACCHLGPRGNSLLAEQVAAAVRRRLELDGCTLQSLAPEPQWLLQPVAIAPPVWAIDQAGVRHDVAGHGLGTELVADPADLVEIGLGGSVRALRRGRGRLQIRHQGLRAEVELVAAWPDRLVLADAWPAVGAPQLDVECDGGVLRIRCSGLPEVPLRLLAIADRPLPDRAPGAELAGTVLVPLGPGASVQYEQPHRAPAGVPTFLRVYALGADASAVVATSSTVVVTQG